MVDLVITPANVQQANNASIKEGISRFGNVAGQTIFLHPTGLLQTSQNGISAIIAAVIGITLHTADAGQILKYIVRGDLDPGAVLIIGETYVLGTALGSIAPIGDIGIGDFTTILGIASSANNLKVNIFQGGTAHA